MARSSGGRRPAIQISMSRAARLYRLVSLLAGAPATRIEILGELGMGLRTFYRELELLRRCGIRVRLDKKVYTFQGTLVEAERRLPFPDPQLSFAEVVELARGEAPAALRLASLLAEVLAAAEPVSKKGKARGKAKAKAKAKGKRGVGAAKSKRG